MYRENDGNGTTALPSNQALRPAAAVERVEQLSHPFEALRFAFRMMWQDVVVHFRR
jgi:hypothetical protein